MVFPHLSVKAGTPCPHVPGDLALAAADPGEAKRVNGLVLLGKSENRKPPFLFGFSGEDFPNKTNPMIGGVFNDRSFQP